MARLLIVLFLILCQQVHAEILVSVDRDPVVADESFQLIFESDEKVSGQPDFDPLKNIFTILSTSSSSNTQIINGKVSSSRKWILTVLANKTGKIKIPAISFGNEQSQPRTINIVASAPSVRSNKSDDIFVDVKVSTLSPYVQAQVIYTVKLYRSIPTNNASLTEPKVSGGQAVINKLGDDKSYETRLNGKRYTVVERNYIIFPQSSGQLKIDPLIFQAQTGVGNIFDFDPFGQQSKSIVRRSDEVTLDVKPIPDSFTGKNWLPAENLNIQEQWSVAPDKLKQGDAVTRTLTLQAKGLAASNLPAIDDALPDGFKHYPDQPEFEENNDANGFVGIRREKMAIIPLQAGKYLFPAIKIPWWNTKTDKMEIAELPERSIRVEASPSVAQNVLPGKQQALNKTPVVKAQENNNVEVEKQPVVVEKESSLWKWVSLGLFLLWMLTIIVWWLTQRRIKNQTIIEETSSSSRAALKELRNACHQNSPVKTREAILEWARINWPDKRITSISQLKNYCSPEFKTKLDELNNILYGKNNNQWNGKDFLKVFEAQIKNQKQDKTPAGKLEPLYKT